MLREGWILGISYAAVPSTAREQPGAPRWYRAGLAADRKHLVRSLKKDLKGSTMGEEKHKSSAMRSWLKAQRQAASWALAAEAY